MKITKELAVKIRKLIDLGARCDFVIKSPIKGNPDYDVVVSKHNIQSSTPLVFINGVEQYCLPIDHDWFNIPYDRRLYNKSWRYLLSLDKPCLNEYSECDDIYLTYPSVLDMSTIEMDKILNQEILVPDRYKLETANHIVLNKDKLAANIKNLYTMPKLSEKAVLTTAGEQASYNRIPRKLKKQLRGIKHPRQTRNISSTRQNNGPSIDYYQKTLDHIARRSNQKPDPIVDNYDIAKNVCLKHTNGTIFRLSKEKAKIMLENEPSLYSYCSKTEWKQWKVKQHNSKEPHSPQQPIDKTINKRKAAIDKFKSDHSLRPKIGFNKDMVAVKVKIGDKKVIKDLKKYEAYTTTEMVDVNGVLTPTTVTKYAKKVIKNAEILEPIFKLKMIRCLRKSLSATLTTKKKKETRDIVIVRFYKNEEDHKNHKIAKVIREKKIKGDQANKWHDSLADNWKKKYPEGVCTMSYLNPKTKASVEKIAIEKLLPHHIKEGKAEVVGLGNNSFISLDKITTYKVVRKRLLPTSTKEKKWKFTPKVKSCQRRDLKKGVY